MDKPNTRPSLEIPFEYVQTELELLYRYRGLKERFLKLFKSGEMLALVRDNFQDSPAVMAAYSGAMAVAQERLVEQQSRYPTCGITWEKVMEDHVPKLSEVLYGPIADYVRSLEDRTSSELAQLFLSDTDFAGLRTLTKSFTEREDLIKPFPGNRWNWHRVFPTQINGTDYEATVVVSPDSGMCMNFMIENFHSGQKRSATVDLNTSSPDDKKTPIENLRHGLVQIGLGSVVEFLSRLQGQRQVMSGEAYPTIDVFSTALKLNAGIPLSEKEAYPDPMAAYALALEMDDMQLFNSRLNAMEYAACSPRMDSDTLRDLPNKPAEFVYHVIHGLLNLYKHMLMEANGNRGNLRAMSIGGESTEDGGETFDAKSYYQASVERTLGPTLLAELP